MNILLPCLAMGGLVGLLAGLLGLGGGLTTVPLLIYLFHHQGITSTLAARLAVGTSLATVSLTSLTAITAHHRRGAILWPWVKGLLLGIIPGALILGPLLASHLSATHLHGLFTAFCLFMALKLFLSPRGDTQTTDSEKTSASAITNTLAGSAIGALSTLLGIGGGSLSASYLYWRKLPIRQVVGTSAALCLPISVAGTVGYLFAGQHQLGLPPGSTGYIYWPALLGIAATSILTAPLGTRLAHSLPTQVLKWLFALLLLVVGIKMGLGI